MDAVVTPQEIITVAHKRTFDNTPRRNSDIETHPVPLNYESGRRPDADQREHSPYLNAREYHDVEAASQNGESRSGMTAGFMTEPGYSHSSDPPPMVHDQRQEYHEQENQVRLNAGRRRKVNVDFSIPTNRDRKATGAVLEYAKGWKGPRRIADILIKNVPVSQGGKAWHAGGTNGKAPEHVTAQLFDADGNLMTTVHVDRDGKVC
ncbi:hypothetical protein QBC41DRAFT_390420 [Cercophora samala]|uniref:Uncharacterized protein n=1 Tax=Cercophora samala TaxID=330535 RepID=A0AA39ZGC9_9PEZI|nr:hypothetical protein QBC41DRAFT_390420 [Cercophora samala]